jgi:transglutaminase-like putative cysteine protease/predicted glutamine amidotransferase
MPNLLAMSFEGELAPSVDLSCLRPGGTPPDGWGIGYYPAGEPSASVLKEPAPREGSIRNELVKTWEHLASNIFVLHLRRATWGGRSDANTQPFARAYAGREWLFAHAGSLRTRAAAIAHDARFEPVGSTDTEALFCRLLEWIASNGWRSLDDVPLEALRSQLLTFNEEGSLGVVFTDGRDLCAFSDAHGQGSLFAWQILPPYREVAFGDTDLEIDLSKRGAVARKGVVIASDPLFARGDAPPAWRLLEPAELLVVRHGATRASLRTDGASVEVAARLRPAGPLVAKPRHLRITHRTVYRYAKTVEHSTHMLRIVPAHDRTQTLRELHVTLSVDGDSCEYDDVFGNRARRVRLMTPYDELIIEARSRVTTLEVDPIGRRGPHARATIPLVWMPWQRHMLQPYLLPPELPESELLDLSEYAMRFVERNDFDLLDALLDINRTIFDEYTYVQGVTAVTTTPFEVYANRRGVCQDFANLFICLARMLGAPARYVCGYIFTGPKHDNIRQSEASHAWAQVYLPEMGWVGFDPTNGCVTQTDHVRVAVGRNYLDATPTSGTIFVGGGHETLEVDVRVEPDEAETSPPSSNSTRDL